MVYFVTVRLTGKGSVVSRSKDMIFFVNDHGANMFSIAGGT
jgi:hypothetical protein